MPVTVAEILRCTGHPVQRITLQVQPDYSFEAGQYLAVQAENIEIPLSIASAPARLPELELHYRSTPGAAEAVAMDHLLQGSCLAVSDARGDVHAGSPDQPLLIIAGGSGAAQAFSCAEHRSRFPHASTTVVWCADREDDIYAAEQLADYVGGRLQICIDDRRTAANEGMLWLRQHASDFYDHRIVLSGSPGFVYAVTDLLLATGCEEHRLCSDVYAYAPRN